MSNAAPFPSDVEDWLSWVYVRVQVDGALLPGERAINFLPPLSAVDNHDKGSIDVSVTGGGAANATSIQSIPVNAPSSPTTGTTLVSLDGGATLSFAQITQDMIAAGLSVTLSGGGATTLECGATWTPSAIAASPACNASGVTAATLNDTSGGTVNELGQANPLASPSVSYTKTASAATESISLTMTKGGVTKTSNLLTTTWLDRYGVGVDAASGATGATVSGNNATLTGGGASGTLTGTLAAVAVGTTFSASPSFQYIYFWCLHTSTAHTFASGGFTFTMSRVQSNVSYANQFGTSKGYDLYRSDNLLNTTYAIQVTA